MPTTIQDLRTWKQEGRRFAMLTCYDFPTAQILDEAGIPVLLVGDSVANNILGYDTTIPVTMEEMLHHTRAVVRGARNPLIVGDLPFLSYQASIEEGIRNAGRFLKAGTHAVKLEGWFPELTEALTARGIPVMGHLGLTPQSVNALGGYRVQGRGERGEQLLAEAHELQEAGCFALVLEAVPAELGTRVTQALDIPTIGIGAGPGTDAQVLVISDLIGLTPDPVPRFVKRYADLRSILAESAQHFAKDVSEGHYPAPEHQYH